MLTTVSRLVERAINHVWVEIWGRTHRHFVFLVPTTLPKKDWKIWCYDYVLVFTTNLQIHIVTCRIHPHIHHTSRTPYLFHSFSDFAVYVVTTLIFPKNQRQCASFSINAAILFLSFKRATTVPN